MSNAFKVERFSDFVGQDKPKRILQLLCAAAKKRGSCLPHILLSGPPGLGKSSLGSIVAEEMGTQLVELVAGNIQSAAGLAQHILAVPPGGIVLLDEAHGLPRPAEEALYTVMTEFRLCVSSPPGYDGLMKQLGMPSMKPTVEMKQLPEFTVIGATTLSGLISDPLRSRFVEVITLQPYKDAELRLIITKAAKRMGMDLPEDTAMEIARRSRQTARTALGHLRFLSEYCVATGTGPDVDAARAVFELKDVDEDGLGALDREYLLALVEAETPLGLSTLSASLSTSPESLAQVVEPFLLRQGFIRKGPRGRVALPKAFGKVGRAA